MKKITLSITALLVISCDAKQNHDIDYMNTSGPLRTAQSFGTENIFFDIEIDGIEIANGDEIYFPTGSNGLTTTLTLPQDTGLVTGFNYSIDVNFYIKDRQNYRLFATATDTIRWDNSGSNVILDAMTYQYLDVDGNGVIDVHEMTEQTTERTGFIFTQYADPNSGGWGPRIPVVLGNSVVEQIVNRYENENIAKLQVANPSPNWQWIKVGSEANDKDWYAYEINRENAVSCDPTYRDDNISSFESTLNGLGFIYFKKGEVEFLTSLGTGHVDDLSSYNIGNVYSVQSIYTDEEINISERLNDGKLIIFAPRGLGGWLQVWMDEGREQTESNPSCLFNLTSPSVVSQP